MPKNRPSLKVPRAKAFAKQGGRCCYCHQPVWLDNPSDYAQQYGLSLGQARLMQCTGEHLRAHSEGGSASQQNIAAACWFCNTRRHKAKTHLTPDRYELHVMRRLAKGKWHCLRLV